MSVKEIYPAGRLSAALMLALALAACGSTKPAPVVNRTNLPPAPQAQPPFTMIPGQTGIGQPLPPAVSPTAVPGSVTIRPGEGQVTGVEASPVRSGSIESATIQTTPSAGAPGDPNLKTGPKGFKRPYGDMAAVDPAAMQRGSTTGADTSAPVVIATTIPPAVATAPPAMPAVPAAPPEKPAPAAAGGTGLLDGVAFAWPASGTVLQNFDETSSKGLALGGKAGDAVRAAADGRVIFSGAGPRGYGNLIIVKHSNELLSVYAHNRSLAVKEGETVKRGQKIAELGNSGTDKPKLHFEIRQQGKPIDPIAVLPKR